MMSRNSCSSAQCAVVRKLPQRLATCALVAGCALSLCATVRAQQADATAPAATPAPGPNDALLSKQIPIAEVDEPRHDFGTVWATEALQHAFVIRNAGDEPLRIIRVKPSCGCTVAGEYPETIDPGKTGSFPFQLNAKHINGKFTKSVTVTTNDTKNSQIYLSLSGEVRKFIDIEPSLVQFGRVKVDSVITNKVMLTNNTDKPLEISLGDKQNVKCFGAEIKELEPGKKFELTVTAHPPFETGINRVTIPIKTNIPEQDTLEVACAATLPERIELRPDKLQISSPVRAETVRRFSLTNNGEEPLHITSVESSDPRLLVESKALEDGRKYQLSVTVPVNYANPPAGASIVIKTDDAKDAELSLPVIAHKSTPRRTPSRPAMGMLGEPAPDSKAGTFDGNVIEVGGKQDKVQVLVFYASWCGFCRRALPKVEALQEKYADNKDVQFIAVNLDERSGRRARTEDETIKHYHEMKLTMPMVMDAEKEIAKPYKVTSFPTMFVVGKQGDIEAVHVGARAGFDATMAGQIDMLLAGKTRADFPRGLASVPIQPDIRTTRATVQTAADSSSDDDDESSDN
ncbi:MAG: DUF1573 domain-containing protein [Phycisphaerales bacterium]|nr:DUF1573 domain-containing protein [Phycisphaerales bacterium]